ncbi:hypothetical protein [Variovorax paradoxus]|uniref:DUF3592 domain-containing protein n=1 Tax=Variovorax paradoxus TaxID=34073 RepID=A0A0H2MAU8_VARPD|nr:hypothetical protein [Variovorax paradoxus]KLN57802.1 hypothetical protein VPARA_08130 [Variovorax paradoxus]
MPEWETLLWIFFGIVMTAVVVGGAGAMGYMRKENRHYSAEEKRWPALAQAGQPADGVVRNVRMHPNNMTRGGSSGQTVRALVLDVDYTDSAGVVHAASIPTFVEDALVPQFLEPGKAVHLRYDLGNPALVAIDRERTPLEIPRAR